MSELAVQGCSFEASLDTGQGSISATLSAVSVPSTDVLVNNKGVFFDKITVMVATGSSVTLTSPPPGATSPSGQLLVSDTIDISGTADNILDAGGNKAVQKDDDGSKKLTFTFPAPQGAVTTYSVNVTVKVSDAGQTDVTAN